MQKFQHTLFIILLLPLGLKSQIHLTTPGGKVITTGSGKVLQTASASSSPCPVATITDASGKTYHTIGVGTQCWLKENLATTKYNDNSDIPFVPDGGTWSGTATAAYSWYNFDEATYGSDYGALYNWHAVNTGKLCPTGWHVPSDTEWATLITSQGGETLAGGPLKESGLAHWSSPNSGATNETGFTALPGGNIGRYGTCVYNGTFGLWWTSTSSSSILALEVTLSSADATTSTNSSNKRNGFSVRCLRDN